VKTLGYLTATRVFRRRKSEPWSRRTLSKEEIRNWTIQRRFQDSDQTEKKRMRGLGSGCILKKITAPFTLHQRGPPADEKGIPAQHVYMPNKHTILVTLSHETLFYRK
jgi:hypothetical protein